MTKTVMPMQLPTNKKIKVYYIACWHPHVAKIKVDAARVESTGVILMLPVEQQNLHKPVACHTLLPLLFTEVLVLQVPRMNPSEVYLQLLIYLFTIVCAS